MFTIICFTFILLYFLSSISKEDINTMLISEYKLMSLGISGLLYLLCISLSNEKINTIDLLCISLSNEKINTIDLLLNNSFSMLIIFIIMLSISYISYKVLGVNSLGMGDIKLSSISAIWLGIELSFFIILHFIFTISDVQFV